MDEEVAGTNGIGTVLEEMRPIEVVGPEHYVAALQTLTCVGVPIRHPLSGRLEGVLDLACPTADANSLLLPTVIDLGAQIERELFERVSDSERSVLRAFVARNRETTRPLIALTDQFMMANASASPWLDGVDQAFLLEQGDMASLSGGEVVREMSFSQGRTAVARCRPVRAGLKIAGLLIEIDAGPGAGRRPIPATRPERELDRADGGRDGRGERLVAPGGRPLRPAGPDGARPDRGRGGHREDIARPPPPPEHAARLHLHGAARHARTRPGHRGVAAPRPRRPRARPQPTGRTPAPLVLTHVDWLSEPAAIALGDMLDLARDTAPLVISTLIPGDRPAPGPLEDRLRTQVVTLPPLRGRPEDIAGIANALIRRHASGRTGPRIVPSALRLLMRTRGPATSASSRRC